jgi:glutamate--cysteine ligase catalytic subunit
MELQLTDDENIAFSMLSHVFVRLFYSEEISKLNLYIPISKLDENFRRAQKRNALLTEKFYFRTNIYDAG